MENAVNAIKTILAIAAAAFVAWAISGCNERQKELAARQEANIEYRIKSAAESERVHWERELVDRGLGRYNPTNRAFEFVK